jgi:asparagine synthase (glutamine-hydrolysing)
MGFSVPVHQWLRGPLKSWAGDLLFSLRSEDDLLNRSMVEKLWKDHQSGNWDYADHLWRILMFRSWQERHA